ncbi:MAG: alpha/beta hydrolase [Dehalococcoidia bacterium]
MFAKINNVDIHYQILGDGPTLVWLHGLMGSIERARVFGEGFEELANHGVRLVLYDARGHGQSGFTPDDSDYTWESHARDMLGLLDHLGIERAALGGGSMGARASVIAALAQPERVEKLVLHGLPGFGTGIKTAQDVFLALASLIEAVGVEKAADIVMQLPQYAELKESDPEEHARMDNWFRTLRPDSTVATIRGLLNDPHLEAEQLRAIHVPTLVVGHTDDPIHPIEASRQAHEAIAGSQLVTGEGLSYWRDHHDELIDEIAKFLRA